MPARLYDLPYMGSLLTVFFQFFFFRAGEITVPAKRSFSISQHLAWGDVAVDSIDKPTMVKVHLKISKCDQLGKGVDVLVGRTSSKVCPVVACLSYIAVRGPGAGPFFRFQDGSPLTKAAFVWQVSQILTVAGLQASLYGGHSFIDR